MKFWSLDKDEYVENGRLERFMNELEGLLRRYDVSLGHEDTEGSFVIENGFNGASWIKGSSIKGFKDVWRELYDDDNVTIGKDIEGNIRVEFFENGHLKDGSIVWRPEKISEKGETY